MAETLYGAAAELAALSGRERVLDLFCGIGTIALTLATRARNVVGVELVEKLPGGLFADRLEDVGGVARRGLGDGQPVGVELTQVVLDLVGLAAGARPKLACQLTWPE